MQRRSSCGVGPAFNGTSRSLLAGTAALLAATAPAVSFAQHSGEPAAKRVSYSGRWPVSAALPPHFGNTGCLALVETSQAGAPPAGTASVSGDLDGGLTGTFQVVNHLMVVNIESGSDTGEVVYSQFIAPAGRGDIGDGVFNEAGYFAPAALTVGQKGGC